MENSFLNFHDFPGEPFTTDVNAIDRLKPLIWLCSGGCWLWVMLCTHVVQVRNDDDDVNQTNNKLYSFRRLLKTHFFAPYWSIKRIRGSTRMRYTSLLTYLLYCRRDTTVQKYRPTESLTSSGNVTGIIVRFGEAPFSASESNKKKRSVQNENERCISP